MERESAATSGLLGEGASATFFELPPSGEEPIAWLLLTNKRIKTFRAASQGTGWYESRWIVEEYHKSQKTGVSVE